VDLKRLVARAQAILTAPRTEWAAIAAEPATAGGLYSGYVIPLAATAAVFGWLRMAFIGIDAGVFGRYRMGAPSALGLAVVSLLASLITVYVLALVVDALAPSFSGRRDPTQALKLVAYSYTASWVAAVAGIIPALGGLVALAGAIYAVYLFYLGLPKLMSCPQDKAIGYTVVVIIIAILIETVVSATIGALALPH
jgi:hypothetical protein